LFIPSLKPDSKLDDRDNGSDQDEEFLEPISEVEEGHDDDDDDSDDPDDVGDDESDDSDDDGDGSSNPATPVLTVTSPENHCFTFRMSSDSDDVDNSSVTSSDATFYSVASRWVQGCQMAHFQTKNYDPGKFWRALECKTFVYFIPIRNILRPFGIFYGHLVIVW
jgi:hypothetical protein